MNKIFSFLNKIRFNKWSPYSLGNDHIYIVVYLNFSNSIQLNVRKTKRFKLAKNFISFRYVWWINNSPVGEHSGDNLKLRTYKKRFRAVSRPFFYNSKLYAQYITIILSVIFFCYHHIYIVLNDVTFSFHCFVIDFFYSKN